MASFTLIGKYGGATPLEEVIPGFSKRIFKIETNDKFPVHVFELHKNDKKDNTGLVSPFKIGQEINVYFNWNCKEKDGRYYNNMVAWKIEPTEPSNQGQYKQPENISSEGQQFA